MTGKRKAQSALSAAIPNVGWILFAACSLFVFSACDAQAEQENSHPLASKIDVQVVETLSGLKPLKWQKKTLKLGYRIIGKRFSESVKLFEYEAISDFYSSVYQYSGPAYTELAKLELEELFLTTVNKYERATGVAVEAKKLPVNNETYTQHPSEDFDLVIDIYKTAGWASTGPRLANLQTFLGFTKMQEAVGSKATLQFSFIPSGWAGLFSKKGSLKGAACEIAFPPEAFWVEIGHDIQAAITGKDRRVTGSFNSPFAWPHPGLGFPIYGWGGLAAEAFNISRDQKGSPIWEYRDQDNLYFRLDENGRAVKNTSACRVTLLKAYRKRWRSAFDSCLAGAFGFPLETATAQASQAGNGNVVTTKLNTSLRGGGGYGMPKFNEMVARRYSSLGYHATPFYMATHKVYPRHLEKYYAAKGAGISNDLLSTLSIELKNELAVPSKAAWPHLFHEVKACYEPKHHLLKFLRRPGRGRGSGAGMYKTWR